MNNPETDIKTSIQIVEDEWIIANDLKISLEAMGFQITSICPTGEEAVENALRDTPGLILMDIELKGEMDGIDTAGKIQESQSIPIIYLTAYADDRVLQRAKLTGPFGYLLKPFEERELYTTIEMSLYKHRMEREREALIKQLQDALANIKTLQGMLPICSSCKKIRDDEGYWHQVEKYIRERSQVEFTHSICQDCAKKLYPEFYSKKDD